MNRLDAIKIVNRAFGLVDTGQADKWVKVLEELGLLKLDDVPDWSEHLVIYTKPFGKLAVHFVGLTSKGKAVVEISTPNQHMPLLYVSDKNGYIVEFDRRIENE